MSLRKRRTRSGAVIWYIDLAGPDGRTRIRRSTGTADKKAAQEVHDRLKADLWRQKNLKEKPDYSFDHAALRFLREIEGKPIAKEHARAIRFWTEHFGGLPLKAVTRDKAAELVE